MWQYQRTDELYHHGILGMRWGHRKSQTSSSSGGVKRKRMSNRAYRKYKSSSKDSRRAQMIKRKPVNQMSNEELKTLNYRQQLEYNYRLNNPSKIKQGMTIAGAIAGGLGTIVTLHKNGSKLIGIGKRVVGKISKKK